MEASWWKRLTGGKLGLVLMGKAMLSKSLIQFSVDGWDCVPSLLFDLRPDYGGGSVLLNSLHSVLSLKTSPLTLINLKEIDMGYVLVIFWCMTNQPPDYFIFFDILLFFVWYYLSQFEECWRSWLSSAGQFSLEVSHAVLVSGVRVSSKLFFTLRLSGQGWLSTRTSAELLLENRAWTSGLSKLPGLPHSLVVESQGKECFKPCYLLYSSLGCCKSDAFYLFQESCQDWLNSWGTEITSIFLKEDQKTYGHTLQPPLI